MGEEKHQGRKLEKVGKTLERSLIIPMNTNSRFDDVSGILRYTTPHRPSLCQDYDIHIRQSSEANYVSYSFNRRSSRFSA